MKTALQWLNVVVPLCRSAVWSQDQRSAGGTERAERREGKIKADGTPWGRSAGQALVCTLLGAAPQTASIVPSSFGRPSFARLLAAL